MRTSPILDEVGKCGRMEALEGEARRHRECEIVRDFNIFVNFRNLDACVVFTTEHLERSMLAVHDFCQEGLRVSER